MGCSERESEHEKDGRDNVSGGDDMSGLLRKGNGLSAKKLQ